MVRTAATASEIRRRLGISRGSRVNVWDVAGKLGLEVYRRSFRGAKLQEITIGRRIAISDRLTQRNERWAIAHGIGHAVLHRGAANHVWLHTKGGESADDFETEADTFAFHLLVSVSRLASLYEDYEIAQYYGIPMSRLVAYRVYGQGKE